ncbi:MAG: non-ribosomal peptide synthetase, partial [Acidobacteria bacterium]
MRGARLNSSERIPAITPRPNQTRVPLSLQQLQVWLHAGMAVEVPFYNETITFHRQGPLSPDVLQRCLCEVVRRHEIWRTTFEIQNGEPVQIINPPPSIFPLEVADLSELPESQRVQKAAGLARENARRPFDVGKGPLLRAFLVRMGRADHRLYMTFHQLIFDGITAQRIFLREIATLYDAFSAGKPSPLPEPLIQYGDFAYWQRDQLAPDVWARERSFWEKQLAGKLPVLEWPSGHQRPILETHRGEILRFTFEEATIGPVRTLSQREGASMYMTLLAAFGTVLHRYTGQDDIIIGGLSAGRNRTDTESIPGFFVNPLALRIDFSGNPTFREVLNRVRTMVLESLAHAELPFAQVVKQVQQKSDPSRHPLFQIMLSQQPRDSANPDGWDWAIEEVSNGGSKMDLFVILDDRGDGIFGSTTYNPDFFDGSTVSRFVGHWRTLLQAAGLNPDEHISELPMLTEAERNQILVEWNNTQRDYETDACLHELIERQVEQSPDVPATIYEQHQLSYRELNARANQLAHHLRQLDVGPETLVGVCMERSIEMIVSLLGILKAGGAYVPLDPEYPKDRLRMMLDDSRVPVLLTQKHLLEKLPASSSQLICVDSDWEQIARESRSNPDGVARPHNAAYAIYTSGSTGKPKGVLNIHSAIVNRLLWMQDAYGLTNDDRVLQKTPYSFDVSIWEFFWPLITGACLVIAKPGGHKDPDYLMNLIYREKITTLHFVPSMLQALLEVNGLEACSSLRRVICSGEALSLEVQRRFFARCKAELHNLYGPTEAAVDVTFWQCQAEHDQPIVPIGRPIANVTIYVLDRNLHPVPVGIPGELHIGGVALARGYLNRPELTAQKFISDPFSSAPGARLYKTGDLARYMPNGAIEFLGRIDDQVKIRGFRIELGEIEAVLHEHPAVCDARVIVREDLSGDCCLVAYIVTLQGGTSSGEEIREFLKEKLPGYMVPTLVTIDHLPVTPNGKLDRRALPTPEREEHEETFDEPTDEIEQMLAEIWTDVLGVERVGLYDNFFDLCGHSLSAIHVVARLRSRQDLRIRPNELPFQTLGQIAASCKAQLHC